MQTINPEPPASGLQPPASAFKSATAIALKAIGHKAELEVGFTVAPQAITEGRVQLPEPGHDLTREDIGLVRGAADAAALRLRYHDEALHIRRLPNDAMAQALFRCAGTNALRGFGGAGDGGRRG